jgi:membrane-associated phospholipid phosphatase
LRKTINIKGQSLIWVLAALLLLTGTFFDYNLDAFLYTPNSLYGRFFYVFCQLPFYWGILLSLLLFSSVCKKEKLKYFIANLLLVFAAVSFCISIFVTAYKVFEGIWIYIFGIVLLFAPVIFLYQKIEHASDQEKKRYALFTMLVCLGQFVITLLIKEIWDRPRYWVLNEFPSVPFVPWWKIDPGIKAQYMNEFSLPADGFKSFPSAHTSCASCILVLSALPFLKSEYKRYTNRIQFVCLLFIGMVALSRMIMGAHFLSDTAAGFLVTYILFEFLWYQFYLKS